MWRALILVLYLLDEIISKQLPVSSGTYAVALLLLVWRNHPLKVSSRRLTRFAGGVAVLLVAGACGGVMSGTPVGAFFLMTLGLLSMLWLMGTTNPIHLQLITPQAAFAGLLISAIFLWISRLVGLDAFALLTGDIPSRPAGLFAEPSHLALYLVPLAAIAWVRAPNRRWIALLWVVLAVGAFSLTLVFTTLLVMAIAAWAEQPKDRFQKRRLVTFVLALPLVAGSLSLLSVGDVPVIDYVSSRLGGLAIEGDDDTHNISSLVVLQGFDLAQESFTASRGMGVGVGNLGTSPELVKDNIYRDILNTLLPNAADINLRDGALLANKIVGEFGIFALMLLWALFTGLRRLRRLSDSATKRYHAAFLATAVSLIAIRALPYFAAPTCLAIVSMAALASPKRVQSGTTGKAGGLFREPLKGA